ncbi:MAG: single-stranded DNA-binding protein [Clostridiales bacterium]|nr:single-stranded DNA-binding protein [Clostridiales bacterium]MBQ1574262.1 single-stranded DNA-binding protein [Clostridiales bacterium]
MNICAFIGRMVYDPELKQTKNGNSYLPVRIAIDRRDKEKNTDFISCRAWGKTAEFIFKYFHKGDPIEIIGRLQSESYEKQDGTKVSEMVVIISEANFVPKPSQKTDSKKAEPEEEDGELPFEV